MSCSSSSKINDYSEPLINVYGKIKNRQYVEFLEKDGIRFKITRFSYTINLEKNIVLIGGGDSMSYDINAENVNVNHYKTSESFRKSTNKWNEKYYKAIAPNFIEINNKGKMEILYKLSQQERLSPTPTSRK